MNLASSVDLQLTPNNHLLINEEESIVFPYENSLANEPSSNIII